MSQYDTRGVVAWVKAYPRCCLKVFVKEKLDTMSVREMLFCRLLCLEVMNQTERRYRTGLLGIYNINFYIYIMFTKKLFNIYFFML